MKKFLALLIAAVMLTLPACVKHKPIPAPVKVTAPAPEVQSPLEKQHASTHRIGVYAMNTEIGHCSGTAVGPNAILTAQHCFKDSNLIRLDKDKEPVKILAALVDGNDHVIYILDDVDFPTWAGINERQLVAKEPVHIWGAPGKNADVYRTGYFQKYLNVKEVDPSGKILFEMFILPTFGGDSGSGIFDEKGSVVAVVSMGDESADNLDLPLTFTQDQLDITQP